MTDVEKQQLTSPPDAAERVVKWVARNQKRVTVGLAGVVVLAGSVWFMRAAEIRREQFAARELAEARFTAQSRNFQLATSDLTGIVSNYGATSAGQEAVLVLANVRLAMGEAELAVTELTEFLDGRPLRFFRGPASGLLAGAFEELGRFPEASEAYGAAAEFTELPLIRGELLLDQARTASVGGDRDGAIAIYQAILEEFERNSPINVEASARLAEINQSI